MRFLTAFVLFVFHWLPIYSQSFNLELEQKLAIGEENAESDAYLFSGIRTVTPHPNGTVLIADANGANIRVFDRNGVFLQTIGQRGRGPGDFREVTFIEILKNGNITVVDRMSDRVSIFEPNGHFLFSSDLEDQPLGTMQFAYESVDGQGFLLGYRDYLNAEQNGYFFHKYNYKLDEKEADALNLFTSVFDQQNPFENRLSISPKYLSTRFGSGQVALLPYIYTGNMAVIDIQSLKTRTIGSPISDPYTIYDWEDQDKLMDTGETGFAIVSGQTGKFFFKSKGANFGLVGNSRFLLQFYMLFEGEKMIPYVTIYSSSGNLLANISLESSPVNFTQDGIMSFIPHFLDESNKLYTSDYYYKDSFPAVRVFETNLDELLKQN